MADKRALDRYQDDEENFRVFRTLSGITRGRILTDTTGSLPFSTCVGHISRPLYQKTSHMHGVYGRESIPAHEGPRPQMSRQFQREEHPFPDNAGVGTYPRSPFLPPRYQTREYLSNYLGPS